MYDNMFMNKSILCDVKFSTFVCQFNIFDANWSHLSHISS